MRIPATAVLFILLLSAEAEGHSPADVKQNLFYFSPRSYKWTRYMHNGVLTILKPEATDLCKRMWAFSLGPWHSSISMVMFIKCSVCWSKEIDGFCSDIDGSSPRAVRWRCTASGCWGVSALLLRAGGQKASQYYVSAALMSGPSV
jgi:hypothetical protein